MTGPIRSLKRICLVNMPFFRVGQPSFVLTQLKGVLDARFAGNPSVELHYLNHDFARFLGLRLSERISFSNEIVATGIGEWFFRTAAFPGSADVPRAFFNRYFPGREFRPLEEIILGKREQVDTLLDELLEKYRLYESDIVGFSSMVAQNLASFALARKIKERNGDCVVVMGGANCVPPLGQEIVQRVEAIDFVFVGPSLVSFPRFIESIAGGEPERCHRMRGILSKSNCAPGGTHRDLDAASANGEELDIDERIALDYDSYLESLDRAFPGEPVKPVLMFETSRGCWWGERSRCSFCGMDSYTLASQVMSPERAVETINAVLRYAPRCTLFMATDIIMPKHYPRAVFSQVRCPPGTAMLYEVRATLDDEDLRLISEAGVKGVSAGIECLSTSSLRLVHKGTSAFGNIAFLKRCLLADVYPAWLFLVGIPGESGETYRKYIDDIPALFHLPPPYYLSPVIFERHNEYCDDPKAYGLTLAPYDCYDMIYPYGEEAAGRMALLFTNTNTRAEHCRALFAWFTKMKRRINEWIDRWYGRARAAHPMLCLARRDGRTIVYDSRGDAPVEHEIDERLLALLGTLERPARRADLEERFPAGSGGRLEDDLSFLRERGLLFEEGDRCMSLVVERRTRPFSFTSGTAPGSTSLKTAWDKEFDRSIFEDAGLTR